jgi:phage tail sheath gpL-like
MGITKAVSPSVKVPGLYLVVNLLAGVQSPGTAAQRALVMAPESTAGTLTADTEIRLLSSADDAKTAFGTKTPGYLFAAQFFAENPTGVLYAIAPTASAGAAATGTITFASTPSASRTARIIIAGRVIDVAWNANEAADTVKTRAIGLINARDDVPAVASSGGVGVLTLTFPVPGPWGNDVLYSVKLIDGAGGTAVPAGSQFAGGTTEPDFTNALATAAGQKWDFIGLCCSNADATSASTTSNPGRLKTHINTYNTGLNANLQQGMVGATGSLSGVKTGTIGRNEPTIEMPFCMNGQGLPSELCGAEIGGRMAALALDPNPNRIGAPHPFYLGAADLIADTPTFAELQDALSNGVSIVTYDAQGTPIMARPITTHSQDANGNPDSRALDVSGIDGIYAVANDLEVFLPQAFKGAKVTKDLEPGDEPPPAGVVEERDIKTETITRLRFWVSAGVVRRDLLDQAIADGSLIVQVDPSDNSQVNLVVPLGIFPLLAKFGLVVNKAA